LYEGFVAWLKKIPLVFHVRASDRDRYDRIIYRCPDRIILVANALRNRFNWVTDNTKFITVYNGVDLREFDGGISANQESEKANQTESGLLILCSGRIEPAKGQIYLIEACAKLNDRQITFHLLFAGDVANKEYLADCQQKVAELEMRDHISFPGHIENILEVLSRADIFVLPSISGEAFSRAIIEAMAMGKPIVATDVGGAKEAIEDGVSGFIVPPADSTALAERIYILATDEKLRHKFGAAARKRVEELFTIEKNVKNTEQIYAELLGGKKQ
jgi:glycosyltransferase involved in cell wall biosynthesis